MKTKSAVYFSTLILGLLLVASCGGRKMFENFQGTSSAQAAGVITVRVGWLKNKKRSFDTELWFINDSKGALSLPVGKIGCAQGALTGSFRFSKFNSQTVSLAAGEQKRIVGICELYSKDRDATTFSITFRDIAQQNDSGDAGKVLAKELVLNLVPASSI